jgi:hypothetical protein
MLLLNLRSRSSIANFLPSVSRLGVVFIFSSNLHCSKDSLARTDDSPPTIPSATSLERAAPSPSRTLISNEKPGHLASSRCNEQSPQDFLIRAHVNRAPKTQDEQQEQRRLRAKSIAYRTQQYGYFKGFGDSKLQPVKTKEMSQLTRFFGIPVRLNQRIIPALKCVEDAITLECNQTPYTPTILSGLRAKNTYSDGEVSNHVYGIAIDIDPLLNPCCNCVAPWKNSALCRGEKSVWERMSLPRCWVNVFERYGFYWLGHDVLEDTMHFEFLGDPDQILRP